MLKFDNLSIRLCELSDAGLLEKWWNDGSVMAHAGFPNGLGTSVQEITTLLQRPNDPCRRFILENAGIPIGEANYRDLGDAIAEIGIKICEAAHQEKGHGRIFLSMLISHLFDAGFEKIILDTNLKNTRAQHVYEKLGFKKVRINVDAWTDQLGVPQTSIDYELLPADFVDFTHVL